MIPELIKDLFPFFRKKDNSATGSIPGVTGTEKVDFILNQFNSDVQFEESNIARSSTDWNLFSGIDESQYPDDIKADLKDENRNIFQGNFIRSKVWGLAGSIIKNFFDVSFEPTDGEYADQTRLARNAMYSDKDTTDWNASYRQLVVDGLVHQGVEEMYIDTSLDPLGRIGFRNILPNHIILDPDWISNRPKDIRRAFKVGYFTVQEIKDKYKTKASEIDDLIKIKQAHAIQHDKGDEDKGFPYYGLSEIYGDKYRVIEYHYLKKEKRKVEIVVSSGIVVPDGPDSFKKEWAIVNNVDLSDGVIEREEEVDVYYITVICPQISRYLILEDKKALIQIGRLPFFPWSVGRINGKNSGIPELLKSIQRTYNNRESMLDYMISTSAAGGMFIDPNIVDGDDFKMNRVMTNWNKAKFREWSAPGAIVSGRNFFAELPRNQMDYGVVNEINRLIDMADMVSKQPAVMDARSEGSEESGILYARKMMQAEVTNTIMTKSLEQHWNDKGEAWLLLAKKLYSGAYRKFYLMGENKSIEINNRVRDKNGEVIQNDFATLPMMKVVVSQSPEGTTTRTVDRAVNTELLRVIGPENPLARARAVKNVMKTLDNSKEERIQYEQDADLEYQLAKENILTNILNLKMTQMQIQQQLSMAGQPQMPGAEEVLPGQGGGGQPQKQNPPGNPMAEMVGNSAAVGKQPLEMVQ